MPGKGYKEKITAAAVMAAVDKIINEHENGGPIPTDYQLMTALNCSPRTIDKLYAAFNGSPAAGNYKDTDNDEENDGPVITNIDSIDNIDNSGIVDSNNITYSDAIKKLVLYRENMVTAGMLKAGGAATGFIFLAKQKHYGGFTDKVVNENNGGMDIAVKLDFSGSNQGGKIG